MFMSSNIAKRGTPTQLPPAGTAQRGYTLIEIAIAVVVSIALIGFATPRVSGWVERDIVSSETRNFKELLAHARAEAMSRNIVITLDTNLASNDWSGEITVHTDMTNNTSYDSSTDSVVEQWSVRHRDLIITSDTRAGDWISFGTVGQLLEKENIARIAICDHRGKSAGQVITLSLTGQILVDPASSFSDSRVHPITCALADFS